MIRPEKLDAGTQVKGLDYIDVPGNAKRDYKLTFYAYKEGISQLKVHHTLLNSVVLPGVGGYFTKCSVTRFSTRSNLRFCKNEESKRCKINEKGGQLDRKSRRKLLQNA